MSLLDQINTKNTKTPNRIVLHSIGGVGKSTFAVNACKANNGIILDVEDGLDKLPEADGVARLKINCWDHLDPENPNGTSIKAAMKTLIVEDHPYKTLVIDTIDALIPSLDYFVVQKYYGGDQYKADNFMIKYNQFKREFNMLLLSLEMLAKKKNMDIIILAHTVADNHKDPQNETYKRYTLNLPGGDKTSLGTMVYDWCECCLFARFDVEVQNKKGTGNERVVYTEWDAAYDAKNRFGMPKKMPFSYEEIAKYLTPKKGEK